MANCDVVVIGSGHNGLGLAAYAARAGLSTVVVEAATRIGGLLSTEEVTLPGFKHNLHAITLGGYAPFYRYFRLQDFGVSFLRPPIEYVMLLPGRHLIIRTGDAGANFKMLSSFSRKDARSLGEIFRRFHRAWMAEYYSPPVPPGERGQGLAAEDRREYNRLCALSFREALDQLFESEEIKLLLSVRAIEITGDAGIAAKSAVSLYPGTGDLIFRLAFDEDYRIVAGGTNELAQGIGRLLRSLGARIITGIAVEKVVVRDGRATGVRLSNGEEIPARAVVSNGNFVTTMLSLVGEEHLEKDFARAVKSLRPARAGKFDLHLAVAEPPNYRVPEARQALCLFLGYEEIGDIDARWAEIEAEVFPAKPSFHCGCTTVHDPSCAPPGRHTLYLWHYVPEKISRSAAARADDYTERILSRWREYTGDLASANILGRHAYYLTNWKNQQSQWGAVSYSHGQYYSGRPLAICADYRTPIKGLYHCGASSHPGGNVRFGPAHNVAGVLLRDLGSEPWWDREPQPGIPLVADS